jgi:DNA-binding Xre family transcriptional regulator
MRMAERAMFATSDLVPLLAARGVVLSREQVYRLVAKVPERLSLTTLAALCDILECSPAELIEVVGADTNPSPPKPDATRAAVRDIRPRRARITPDAKQ